MTAVPALLLPVGADLYAVPVISSREVVPEPGVTRLPTAPAVVIGLFNLRGQIVPLLDTAALVGTGTTEGAAYAVVIEVEQGLVGLVTTGLPRRQLLEELVGSSELPGSTLLDPAVLLAARLHAPDTVAPMSGGG